MVRSDAAKPHILVIGASGLIGSFLAVDLARRGYSIVAAARSLERSQKFSLSETTVLEAPIVELDSAALARLLDKLAADVVVNCIGALQDRAGTSPSEVHEAFVRRLIAAIRSLDRPILLAHVGVPGRQKEDRTEFSLTKRRGEHMIRDAGIPVAILRPGFVVAPAAYGGSALLRSLAALPIDLPAEELRRPFAAVAVEDIAKTIAFLIEHWTRGDRSCNVSFDLMHPERLTLRDVIDLFRHWLGQTSQRRLVLPKFLLDLGACAGDLAGRLGWAPPICTTALAELRRGVAGDPGLWIRTTGIEPRPIGRILRERPATVQEKWFARLYLLKPLVIAALTAFWCLSGLIALTVAYEAAVAILTSRGFPAGLAHAVTAASSALDIAVGIAIAIRRTCRTGLLAGIAVSAFYMLGAAVLTPDLWFEPLGALVKTGPAIILMLVALAVLDKR
jgi:uncharacterized protein YbjT (DUF2867 family)